MAAPDCDGGRPVYEFLSRRELPPGLPAAESARVHVPLLEVGRRGVLFQKDRDHCLADSALGDADNEIVKVVLTRVNLNLIHTQKRQRSRRRSSFVAVHEWMIAADSVQVCGGHLEDRFVKKNLAECRLDVSHS